MINKAPQSFTDRCRNAQISHSEAQSLWLTVWENSIEEFLVWLIKKGNLNHDQLIQLDALFSRFIKDEDINQNIVDAVAPILNPEQKAKAVDCLAACFIKHLTCFFADHKIKEVN